MTNPLLNFSDLPNFDHIQPDHVGPAVDVLLAKAETALQQAVATDLPAQWAGTSNILDLAWERLGNTWGVVSHLNRVTDTPEFRAAYNAALPRITEFFVNLGTNERLYAKYKSIDTAGLNSEQQQAHKNFIRDSVLGGAELSAAAKERFAKIQERQAELAQKYSENSRDAKQAFTYYATEDEISGIPKDVLQTARALAQTDGRSGYKITLQEPCYFPVMQFADSSALREILYRAKVTLASDQAPAAFIKFDNSAVMKEILMLRLEMSQLLGFKNFGELNLVGKMAKSPDEVIKFLRELAQRALPYAEKEHVDFLNFASESLKLTDPHPWDDVYIDEKHKEARYSFSEQEVRQYFTAPKVLAGLFKIIETLFEVTIHPDSASVWQPSVQFYRIERDGQLLGQFYLDQHARAGKHDGAWMYGIRTRWMRPDTGKLQTPVAYIVCNFAGGIDGKPALLTHYEVNTLFHEFGHGLHHLLTQVDDPHVAGISGVEHDAVELPSQFMENFCWDWDVIKHITAHIDTGEPLPRALFEKMLAAKNFQSGTKTIGDVFYPLFDMLLHTSHNPADDLMDLRTAVRKELSAFRKNRLTPSPLYERDIHTLGYIFAGTHAAGLYGYKWAEVLSADIYATFEETAEVSEIDASKTSDEGTKKLTTTVETGRKFRQTILEVGGSRPAMESFKALRGREPSLDALLRHRGMA